MRVNVRVRGLVGMVRVRVGSEVIKVTTEIEI